MRFALKVADRILTVCWSIQYIVWAMMMLGWRFDWTSWPSGFDGVWMFLAAITAGVAGLERAFRSFNET